MIRPGLFYAPLLELFSCFLSEQDTANSFSQLLSWQEEPKLGWKGRVWKGVKEEKPKFYFSHSSIEWKLLKSTFLVPAAVKLKLQREFIRE